jgi:hypothetical protein
MVGEIKKGHYIYYHCTGNRGKCPEPYTPQEELTGRFASILEELVIPTPVLEWLGDAVLESDRTEQATRKQTISRLRLRADWRHCVLTCLWEWKSASWPVCSMTSVVS